MGRGGREPGDGTVGRPEPGVASSPSSLAEEGGPEGLMSRDDEASFVSQRPRRCDQTKDR